MSNEKPSAFQRADEIVFGHGFVDDNPADSQPRLKQHAIAVREIKAAESAARAEGRREAFEEASEGCASVAQWLSSIGRGEASRGADACGCEIKDLAAREQEEGKR